MVINITKSVKVDSVQPDGVISGYASVFNIVDECGDIILDTAYDDILNNIIMPKMFYNHNSNTIPIGVWQSLSKDSKGIRVVGTLNLELEKSRDIYSAIKQGAIDGLSVCIEVSDYELAEDGTRIIKSIANIPEISICVYPANLEARLDIKSKLNKTNSLSDYEKILREAGFSRQEATYFVSSLKAKIYDERDTQSKMSEIYNILSRTGTKL